MEQVLVKVYGSITPADDALLRAAQSVAEEAVSLSGDMLLVSHEGIYFMMEDFLAAIKPCLRAGCEGRIDYIDVDEWTLTRYWIRDGIITHSTAGLNHVMDHSGH